MESKQFSTAGRVMKRKNPWMQIVPMALTLCLVVMPVMPQRLLSTSHIFPLFTLMAVYYWSMFMPRLMNYTFLFVLGLIQDILFSLPLGGSSLILILFRMLVVSQHRVFGKESFWGLWLWFGLMSALAFAGYWCVISFVKSSTMPIIESFIQWVITVMCYPLMHGFFTRIYRLIPKDKPLAGAL
jgi:rod shape-determining protein MreD